MDLRPLFALLLVLVASVQTCAIFVNFHMASWKMPLNIVSEIRRSLRITPNISWNANWASSKSSCTVCSFCVTPSSLAEYFWIITRHIMKVEVHDARCNWCTTCLVLELPDSARFSNWSDILVKFSAYTLILLYYVFNVFHITTERSELIFFFGNFHGRRQ